MTDRLMYIAIAAIVVIAGGAFAGYKYIYLPHQVDDKRVAAIENYLRDVCATAYLDSSDGKDFLDPNNKQRQCEYGLHAKAEAFSEKNNYDLIQALIATCVNEGGISRSDRIGMRVAALTPSGDGPVQSDEDFCRNKIRNRFPELGN